MIAKRSISMRYVKVLNFYNYEIINRKIHFLNMNLVLLCRLVAVVELEREAVAVALYVTLVVNLEKWKLPKRMPILENW
jgi:hypothetical protein